MASVVEGLSRIERMVEEAKSLASLAIAQARLEGRREGLAAAATMRRLLFDAVNQLDMRAPAETRLLREAIRRALNGGDSG